MPHLRNIREEHLFSAELQDLIPNGRESDEVLEAALIWFSHRADSGEVIPGTQMHYKVVADFQRNRYLIIFYTMDDKKVYLQSVKPFDIPA